jgi:hypothetical protein
MSDLFEQDDFANDPEVIKERKKQQEKKDRINIAEKIFCERLSLEYTKQHVNLERFEMYKAIETPVSTIYYEPKSELFPVKVFLVAFQWTFRSPRNSDTGTDHYLFGWLTLPKKFPPTYIYKGSFGDKLADLFVKSDTQLPGNKKFSRMFRILTEEKMELRQLVDHKSLDELTAFPGLVMEINGQDCFFRVSDNPLDEGIAEDFVALTKLVYRLFG